MATQQELFPKDQMEYLIGQINQLKDSTESVRRGLFARYNQIERDFMDLRAKVEESKLGDGR